MGKVSWLSSAVLMNREDSNRHPWRSGRDGGGLFLPKNQFIFIADNLIYHLVKEISQFSEEEFMPRKQGGQQSIGYSTGLGATPVPASADDTVRKRWRILLIICCIWGGIIFWSFCFLVVTGGMKGQGGKITVEAINKNCPMDLTSQLRLDSAERLSDNTVKLEFTYSGTVSALDTGMMKFTMTPLVTSLLEQTTAKQVYKMYKTPLIYAYHNPQGQYLFQSRTWSNNQVHNTRSTVTTTTYSNGQYHTHSTWTSPSGRVTSKDTVYSGPPMRTPTSHYPPSFMPR